MTETKEGIVLEVFVKPKSREFRIAVEADGIVVFCTEEPVEGRVNKELVKELSRLFGKRVELVSGFSSRQKRLLIRGMDRNEVEARLSSGAAKL
ncbi:MAG: DUF167 family protein [Candidatus Bathyarchaeota archaeon]|nr:DUF167 family protein [Candidatus Bathyarchaeota archaeon]